MTPTDAERATAESIAKSAGLYHHEHLEKRIATALATAHAEGWRAGVEAAAIVVDLAEEATTAHPNTMYLFRLGDAVKAYRALAGPGERDRHLSSRT